MRNNIANVIKELVRVHGLKEIAYQGGVSINACWRYSRCEKLVRVGFLRNLEKAGLLNIKVTLKDEKTS